MVQHCVSAKCKESASVTVLQQLTCLQNNSCAGCAITHRSGPFKLSTVLCLQLCDIQVGRANEPNPESLLAAAEQATPLKRLAAILGSPQSAASSVSNTATMRQLLQRTVQLCTGAFARSPTVISTTIKPLTHLALASQLNKSVYPPGASIWVPPGHGNLSKSPTCLCSLHHSRPKYTL